MHVLEGYFGYFMAEPCRSDGRAELGTSPGIVWVANYKPPSIEGFNAENLRPVGLFHICPGSGNSDATMSTGHSLWILSDGGRFDDENAPLPN